MRPGALASGRAGGDNGAFMARMPVSMMPVKSLSLLSAVLLLAACTTIEHAGLERKRAEQLELYDHAVRWGELAASYDFLEPGLEARPPAGLDNVRVTGYEELSRVPRGEHEFERRVKIEYVLEDRQQVKSLIDHQRWRYDAQKETWLRANRPPEFR